MEGNTAESNSSRESGVVERMDDLTNIPGPSLSHRRTSRTERVDGMETIGLERSMSRDSRGIREREEGNAADMTEMAVPSPVERHLSGIENEVDRVGLERSMSKDQREVREEREGSAGGMTEIAAPFPIRRRTRETREGEQDITEMDVYTSTQGLPVVDREEQLRKRSYARGADGTAPPKEPTPVKRDRTESKPSPPFATELYTISYLIFFSIFGTLARIGLQTLTVYPGAPVSFGVVWANVGGCLIMGFLSQDRNLFLLEEWVPAKRKQDNPPKIWSPSNPQEEKEPPEERERRHKTVKKSIPLYIGLATGFCGSFTSFSTFMRDVYLALSNNLPSSTGSHAARNGGYSFMALLGVILTTVSLSMTALLFGAHLALALDSITPTISFTLTRRYVDRIFVFLAWSCWFGAIIMAIWPPDRRHSEGGIGTGTQQDTWRGRVLFAIVFAPLGCLLRYYLSIHLNSHLPSFPLGTFSANIIGTIIEGACFDLQHVVGIAASGGSGSGSVHHLLTSCQVLQGVMDGFCGCTTTVSTWVAELNGFENRWHGYFYGCVSVAVGLAFLVVIIGTLNWTVGFRAPVCVSA